MQISRKLARGVGHHPKPRCRNLLEALDNRLSGTVSLGSTECEHDRVLLVPLHLQMYEICTYALVGIGVGRQLHELGPVGSRVKKLTFGFGGAAVHVVLCFHEHDDILAEQRP